MHVKTKPTDPPAFRPLTQGEIDRKIDAIGAELFQPGMHVAGAREDASGQPRWISAAELIRRVKPFLADN